MIPGKKWKLAYLMSCKTVETCKQWQKEIKNRTPQSFITLTFLACHTRSVRSYRPTKKHFTKVCETGLIHDLMLNFYCSRYNVYIQTKYLQRRASFLCLLSDFKVFSGARCSKILSERHILLHVVCWNYEAISCLCAQLLPGWIAGLCAM